VDKTETTHAPASLADLTPGQKLTGHVSKVELFGAFVDVGVGQLGLVHISKLQRGKVNRVEDQVKKGDQVEVWVEKVDPDSSRLELTMVKPQSMQWKDIRPGMSLQGEVVRIEKFGAFVDIGAGRPGLVHVSEMRDDFVPDPNQLVSPGDKVDVTVLEVDSQKKQIRLTMKTTAIAEELSSDEPEEIIPTAMEFALRQALDGGEPKSEKQEPPKGKKAAKRHEMEDILSRTLEHKYSTSFKAN
jgi:transcriptional accessory protein Tex/SPT6